MSFASEIYHSNGSSMDVKKAYSQLENLFSQSSALNVHKVVLNSDKSPSMTVIKKENTPILKMGNMFYLTKDIISDIEGELQRFTPLLGGQSISSLTNFEKHHDGIFMCFVGMLSFEGQVGEGALPLYLDDTDVQLVFYDISGKILETIN